MTPEQWRRVRDLFEQALEQPPSSAERWVAQQLAEPDVAAEVVSLLRHHSMAGGFLEASVAGRVADLLDDEPTFENGTDIGTYRIEREIGRGGMGRIYLATDTRLGRRVALKALAPRFVRDPAQRERLRREARAAASLTHPGICTIYALEEIGDDVFIAVEYVDGQTLRAEIGQGVRPTASALLDTARELASALASAHARGITHRDLKPENVMRAAGGTLKILDFGLALTEPGVDGLASPRVTRPGTLVGTPAYMAPEQLNGGVVDVRTDLFALGVLLYEYATGSHPFQAPTPLAMAARILETEPRPLAELREDLPAVLRSVLHRCMRKAPEERFQHAGDLLAALGRGPEQAVERTAGPGAVGWWRTHMAAVIALYFVAVAVGWLVKEWDRGYALAGFVLIAMSATIGGVFRGHLLFSERTHRRAAFLSELRRSSRVLLSVDMIIAAALLCEGLWVTRERSVPGVLIVGLGLGVALARVVLESSTTDAAFGHTDAHESATASR